MEKERDQYTEPQSEDAHDITVIELMKGFVKYILDIIIIR